MALLDKIRDLVTRLVYTTDLTELTTNKVREAVRSQLGVEADKRKQVREVVAEVLADRNRLANSYHGAAPFSEHAPSPSPPKEEPENQKELSREDRKAVTPVVDGICRADYESNADSDDFAAPISKNSAAKSLRKTDFSKRKAVMGSKDNFDDDEAVVSERPSQLLTTAGEPSLEEHRLSKRRLEENPKKANTKKFLRAIDGDVDADDSEEEPEEARTNGRKKTRTQQKDNSESQVQKFMRVARDLGCPVPPSRLRCEPLDKVAACQAYLRSKGVGSNVDVLSLSQKDIRSLRARLDRSKELADLDTANIMDDDTAKSGRRSRRAAAPRTSLKELDPIKEALTKESDNSDNDSDCDSASGVSDENVSADGSLFDAGSDDDSDD
jgi:hypothetical protein